MFKFSVRKETILKYQALNIAFLLFAGFGFAQPENLVIDVNFDNRTGDFQDYDEAAARQDFGAINNRGTGEIRGLDSPGNTWTHKTKAGEQSFRTHYPANKAGGGNSGVLFVKNIPPSEEAIMEYRIKFDPNWFFCYGGKLPGLVGSVDPDGSLPWGGTTNKTTVHSAFSVRLMWRRNDNLVVYAYLPERINSSGKVTRKWGEDIEFFKPVKKGQWYTIKQYVKMNTPGKSDGILEMYVDGKKTLSRTNVQFRLPGKDVKVNGLAVHTYRGGSADDPNFQSKKTEYIYFDYFKVWSSSKGAGSNTLLNSPNGTAGNGLVVVPELGGIKVNAGLAPIQLKVINLNGKVVLSKTGILNDSFIPVEAEGLHLIRYAQSGKEQVQKVLISN